MEHLRGAFALDQENPPAFAVHLRLNGELKNLLKEATLAKRPVSLRLGQGIDKAVLLIDGREYEFSTAQLHHTGLLRVPHVEKVGNKSSFLGATLLGEVHQRLVIRDHQQRRNQAPAATTAGILQPQSTATAHKRAGAERRPHVTPSAAAPAVLPQHLPTTASSEQHSSLVAPNPASHGVSRQAPKALHDPPASKQKITPSQAQRNSDVAPTPHQQQQQKQHAAAVPARPFPVKPVPAVLDTRTAMWAAMKGDLKLVVVAMLYERPMPDMALNKAITSLYTEVRARPEAKEYIKRVVSEACELNMNRWRVREEVLFRELPRLVALNAQHALPPEIPPPSKEKARKSDSKQEPSQERQEAEHQKPSPPLQQQGKKHRQKQQQEGLQDRDEQPSIGIDHTDAAGAKKRRKTEVTASPERRPLGSSQLGDESAVPSLSSHRKVPERRPASASHSLNTQGAGGAQPLSSRHLLVLSAGQQAALTVAVAGPVPGEGSHPGLDLEDDDEDHPMIISRSSQGGKGNSRRNGGLQRQEKRTSPPAVAFPGAIHVVQSGAAAALQSGSSPDQQPYRMHQASQQQQPQRQDGAVPAGLLAHERMSSRTSPWVEHTNSPSPPSQQSSEGRLRAQGEQRVSGDGAGFHRRSDDRGEVGAVGLVRGAIATQHSPTAAAEASKNTMDVLIPALGSADSKVKFDEDAEVGLYQEWLEQRVRTVEHINTPEGHAAAEARYGVLQRLHFGLRQKLEAAIAEVEAWNTSYRSSECSADHQTRATQVWEIGARKWPMMQNWSRAAENLQQELQALQREVLRFLQPTQ